MVTNFKVCVPHAAGNLRASLLLTTVCLLMGCLQNKFTGIWERTAAHGHAGNISRDKTMECSGGSSDFVISNPLKVRGAQQRRKIKPEEQGKSMGMGSVDAISDGRNPGWSGGERSSW